MSFIQKFFGHSTKKENDIVINDEKKDSFMVKMTKNYVSNNADMSKLNQAIEIKRKKLQVEEDKIESHIEKLNLVNQAEDDKYLKNLYTQTAKKEEAKKEEVSQLLNLSDEEITQAYIDKVTDDCLKKVGKEIRQMRKTIASRKNKLANGFFPRLSIVVPKTLITANIIELLNESQDDNTTEI